MVSTIIHFVQKKIQQVRKRSVAIPGIKPSVRTLTLGGSILNGSEVYPSIVDNNTQVRDNAIFYTDPDNLQNDNYTNVYTEDDDQSTHNVGIERSEHLEYTYVDQSGIDVDLSYLGYGYYDDDSYHRIHQHDYEEASKPATNTYYDDYEHLTVEDAGNYYLEETSETIVSDGDDYEVINMRY